MTTETRGTTNVTLADAMLPTLVYLSFDSVTEGVGRSQITPYVKGLARRGVRVVLHTFEKDDPSAQIRRSFEASSIDWRPHPFGGFGSAAGVRRVIKGMSLIRGAELVHARGDLPAASASTQDAPWAWDMRALWTDQRIALGALRGGSPQERVLRTLEKRAARTSTEIVVLAHAVIPVLHERFGADASAKCSVIPTCVDLERFSETPLPPSEPFRFLLLGTLNNYYDVPLMLRLVDRFRILAPGELEVITPERTIWERELRLAGANIGPLPSHSIPQAIREHHIGLSVCRFDAGVSLRAATPTKIGEFLASGRPVVVNPGLGDMDEIIAEFRCGVVLRGSTEEEIDACCLELLDLMGEEDLPRRARSAALKYFDLDQGIETLLAMYGRIAG